MTAVQTGTAQAAAAPTLLDRMNPVTRLGLAVLASLPILITLDWVSALTMLCCQFGVFVACGVPVARLIRRTAPLLLVAPIGALSMALYGRPGGEIHFQWWLITVSDRSLLLAVAVFLRILVLGSAAVILIGGADPTRMADGLAQIEKALR